MNSDSKKYTFCRAAGLCLSAAILAASSAVFAAGGFRPCGRLLTSDTGAKTHNASDSAVTEISVSMPVETGIADNGNLYRAYRKIVNSSKTQKSQETPEMVSDEFQSSTSTTLPPENEQTTVTTTIPSQTAPTTAASRETESESEPKESNGEPPFNYADVSSIASDINTLGDFVSRLSPSSLRWDTSDYAATGCVRVTLDCDGGCVVLDVKPSVSGEEPYTIDSEVSGSLDARAIGEWQWMKDNSSAGCNISSVTWTSAEFGIPAVRGIKVGGTLASLTDQYLCVNGGATTLYKASDVIEDQNKLNSILAAENLYTFVGGKVYSIGSYLEKYYSGREQSFRFEDCDYIVQYGCNSIMEHNYTTGSWIIEYAIKEDVVTGISFMNKSYYKNEPKAVISTNSSSGSELGVITTHTESAYISEQETDVEDIQKDETDIESGSASEEEDEMDDNPEE